MRLRISTPEAPRIRRARSRFARELARACLIAGIVLWCSSIAIPARLAAREAGTVGDAAAELAIAADAAAKWRDGASEIWLLSGNCQVARGGSTASSRDAVVWIEPAADSRGAKVTIYLEGNVVRDGQRVSDEKHVALAGLVEPAKGDAARSAAAVESKAVLAYETRAWPQMRVTRIGGEPRDKPAIYQRAASERFPDDGATIRRTQFTSFDTVEAAVPTATIPLGTRRLRVFPRSTTPVRARAWPNPNNPNETIVAVNTGVNLIVDGLTELGSIDLATDRLVLWTSGLAEGNLSGESLQSESMPLEIYMEGNIVFRQGDRVVYAEKMYYNVQTKSGVVLDAQVMTPVPEYAGLARLKADVVRQIDANHFEAENAAITTSRLGVPSYWFQSERMTFRDIQRPGAANVEGVPLVDPATGQQAADHQYLVGGYGNSVYVEGLPVFYWPTIETDLERPSFYLNEIKVKQDSVFGTQLYTEWDAYQVFGIENPIPGTEWDFSVDYLSERGLAGGTRVAYDRIGAFLPGPQKGFFDAWVIDEQGVDNLGRDRREVMPEEDFRGRALARHRQRLSDTLTFTSELGWVSDRNFLEQYFEREWDEQKDYTSSLELRQRIENSSWSIYGNTRTNDFFTETEAIPRLDHFWLGQSLLFDRLTWYEHSHVGYFKMETATTPLDPVDRAKFDPLAWEADREGLRAATRQEIDAPFTLGWLRVVPYALGEAAHWGDDLAGDEVDRLYGQVGIRSSLPLWSANPLIESELFNVHGVAHKVSLDSDLFFAEANRDLSRFPLYDELDDNSVEHFRRRFFFDTFAGMPGGNVPLMFDERFYALRTNLAGNVTSPSTEIADDLMAAKFGIRQRWQTKRGPPGNQHIIDWITLDTRAVFFPKPDRDNFGEEIGLAEYDFRWHVGDRVTLVSEGIFDFFEDGQQLVSAGAFLNRPPNGSVYLGVRSLEGPFSATILNASFTYKMSPKWIAAAGASIDLGDRENIGQQFGLTRIGESLLVRAGFNVDASRGSVGASIAIEPRFWPKGKLHGADGAQVLPAGPYDVE